MEWIYAGTFGLILLGFIAYGFKLFKEDKKILDSIKEQEEKTPDDDSECVAIEYPFYDYYKGFY
jgi:hypothetical protein